MRRALVARFRAAGAGGIPRAQQGKLLLQTREFLCEFEHGLVLLRLVALQVRIPFFKPGESFGIVHRRTE
jgi:hypothetical protein